MIASFHDEPTRSIWEGRFTRRLLSQIQSVARRKLRMLDAAKRLDDLRIPPVNRLVLLAGDRAGQHSICITDQWRVCFVWNDGNADRVEICDDH